ncbi:hypothetical protein FO519_006849 [Halicephalobus sp. NKZ332]|nr:hypothetical protein FO519_006849 [Halicephalobus sp. NKZ332]
MPKSNLYKGLASIMIDYSAWTSIHGIPHIGMANALWLRLLWVVIVAFCSAMFIYQLVGIIMKYLSYPVNVDTQLQFGEKTFPAVTVCNLNPWNQDLPTTEEFQDLIDSYETGMPADFGFTGDTYDKVQRAKKWAQFLFSDLVTLDATSQASYNYTDLFISCSYNTKNCNETDFSSFYDQNYGSCHTFNFDGRYSSSRAGPLYGLRAVMRIRTEEYLPWVQSAGAVVYIHDKDEMPFMDAFGYFIPVGTASSLGVRFVSREKLPEPYSTCSDTGGSQTNYYNSSYQVEACIRSCLQDKIVSECSCYDPSYAPPTNGSSGSCGDASDPNSKIDCIFGITDTDGSSGFDVNTECSCPQNCLQSYYQVTMSTAFWPASAYTPTECVTSDPSYTYWGNKDECKAWYKDNTLLVEVYYERMNYQVLTESEAYAFINLISDVGGQVGLWLGMSVISIIEFLTLLVLLVCYCLARPTDAYHPDFDEDERRKEMAMQKKMRDKAEKLYGRKSSLTSPRGNDLYKPDNGDPLPPAVQDAR